MNIIVNLKIIPCKIWHPTEPTIEEEQDELLSFPHMTEAFDNVHKPPVWAETGPLKSCLKTVDINS